MKIIGNIHIIQLHSFVDLITNSSTETYIKANQKSVQSVKELINSILELGGSKLKCDDLFDIYLDEEQAFKEYCYNDEDEDGNKMTKEKFFEQADANDTGYNLYIKAKFIGLDGEQGQTAEKILSSLHDLFETESKYNG